jgi:hypothetical protein
MAMNLIILSIFTMIDALGSPRAEKKSENGPFTKFGTF